MRKGEIARYKQFLLFSQCFLPCMVLIFPFWMHFEMSSAICFNLDQSKILSTCNGLKDFTLYHTIPYFNDPEKVFKNQRFLHFPQCFPLLTISQTSPVCSTNLLKTLREKEKLLVMSNFSFSHSVFQPSKGLSTIFIKFKIVVCKFF